MPYDLASFAQGMTPDMQQQYLVEAMRQRQRSAGQEALAGANARGHRFDAMSAIAPMLNNPAAAQAAQSAQKSAMGQAKPVQMGQTGFMLPEQGQFVESPMYVDEKNAARDAVAENQRARLEQQRELERDRISARAEQAAQARQLRESLAAMAEQGRRERAADAAALRLTIAGMTQSRSSDKAADAKNAADEKAITTGVQKLSSFADKKQLPRLMSQGRQLMSARFRDSAPLSRWPPGSPLATVRCRKRPSTT